jgi:quinoprotein glucose dehydrogenase
MAWDPVTRTIIAPVNRLPAIVRLVPSADFDRTRRANPGLEVTEQRGTPFAISRQFFLSASGLPCVAPPWGELVAINADTGETAWRTTLGDLRPSFKLTTGSPVGAINLGGPVVTSTGLVFIGATIDPFVRAFETKSGRQVWEAQLPTGARATPLVFTTQSGREMVAIAAGGFDSPLSKPGTTLVVFGLRDP